MRVEAVFVAVCMVGVALGADGPLENTVESMEKPPKACCVPAQWEATVGGLVGIQARRFSKPELIKELVRVSYDSKGQRVAMNGTVVTHRGPRNFRVIQLFKQKKLYVVDAEGKCVSRDMKMAFKPYCVPKTAKYVGKFREGLGKQSLQSNEWVVSQAGYTAALTFTTGCAPLTEVVWGEGEGRRKVPMMGVTSYANIVAGIKHPAVFTPPKTCKAGESELGEGLMAFMHSKFGETLE